jgi:hypothetical protein
MRLVLGTDEHAKAQVHRRGRHCQIVGRDEVADSGEVGEEPSPPLGDRLREVDDGGVGDEGADLGAAGGRTRGSPGEQHSKRQLGEHDRRDGHGLFTERRECRFPALPSPLERDERARVDHEAHAFPGGRSAAPIRSRSSASEGSGSPALHQPARASRSEEAALPGTGTIRATGSPFRSTRKESPR